MPDEAQHLEADSRLEALLIEGLTAGEDIPVSSDFWRELKKDAAKILDRRKWPGSAAQEP